MQLAELTKLETEAKAKAKEAGDKFESEEFRKNTNVDYIRLPRLRMVVDPDPTAMEAAKRMAEYWKKILFEVDLIPGDQPGKSRHVGNQRHPLSFPGGRASTIPAVVNAKKRQ